MGKTVEKNGASFPYLAIITTLAVFFLWSMYNYYKTFNDNLLSEARALAYQTIAVKKYLSLEQKAINTDSKGGFEFKGVHADAATRKIGDILAGRTDFTIRQVSLKPRREMGSPDKYEERILRQFDENPGLVELYGNGAVGGQKVFRYITPLRMDESCVPCHGGTRGDVDTTGYKKEGYKLGDLVGGLSVTIKSYKRYKAVKDSIGILLLLIFFLSCSVMFILSRMKNKYESELGEFVAAEKVSRNIAEADTLKAAVDVSVPDTVSPAPAENLQMMLLNGIRNPIGDIFDSPEFLKEVTLDVIEEMMVTSNRITDAGKVRELNRLEQGLCDVSIHGFDFAAAFNARVQLYKDICNDLGMQLNAEVAEKALTISSDEKLLLEALDFTFISVVKLTQKENGKLNLGLAIDNDNKKIVITISNNSNRVAEMFESLIFDKFTDIRDGKGNLLFNSGVELTIAIHQLKRLGGGLSYDTANKEGNLFLLWIPLMPQESNT